MFPAEADHARSRNRDGVENLLYLIVFPFWRT
jgi:hypothetical protein